MEDDWRKKQSSLIDKIDSLKEEKKRTESNENEESKSSNQFELFENKLRSILFPEPIFSQYINELKSKPSKAVNFPNVESVLNEQQATDRPTKGWGSKREKTDQQEIRKRQINQPQYTRYLRTWKKNVVQSEKLTSYLSNLRELHLAKLITFIEQMHRNSLYTDLDLYVEDLCFPVHRLILACYAPFIFQKLERTRTKPNPIEKLRLVNIDPQSFATVIGFMYTGIAQPDETNFLPVLNTAIHLFMFDFANAWVELYEHKFTNRTAQMLFRSNIARQYSWSDYVQMLNVALAFDFEHLLISDQFEDIQFDQLRDILQMDSIGVCSEVVLYLAVLKWLSFNFDERKAHAIDLMRLIRFTNMNKHELFACYNPPILPEVVEYPEIKAMMADAFNLLVQRDKETGADDDLTKQQQQIKAGRKQRNYRLSNAYKDRPLQLWCYLNSKRRSDSICLKQPFQRELKDLKETKEFREYKEFRDFKEKKRIDKEPTEPKLDTDSQTSDAISSQLEASPKYSPSTAASSFTNNSSPSASSFTTSPALTTSSDKKVDKFKPDITSSELDSDLENFENLIGTDGQQHETKLAILKTKPRLDDSVCQCKQFKHTSVEQCRRDRAAQIIQRSYKRFRKLKAKKHLDKRKKIVLPKIKPSLIGKNIADKSHALKDVDTADESEASGKTETTLDEFLRELQQSNDTKDSPKSASKSSKSSSDVKRQAIEKRKKSLSKDELSAASRSKESLTSDLKDEETSIDRSKDEERSIDRSKDEERPIDRTKDRSKDRTKDRSTDRSKDKSKDRTKDRTKDRPKDKSKDRTKDRTKDRSKDRPKDRSSSKASVDTAEPFTDRKELTFKRPHHHQLKLPQANHFPSSTSVKSETDHLSSTATKDVQTAPPKRTTRTDQLLLYSDSINPEFCGFFICSGVNSTDGQLIGWQKSLQLNQQQQPIKGLHPPYDTVIVSHGQCIYLVGGMQTKSNNKNFYVSNQIFKYQVSGQKFQTIASTLKMPRIQHSCVVAGDRLYVVCGCKKLNVPANTVECVHLMSSRSLKLKSELIKLPSYGRLGQSAVYFRSRLWIIGGIARIDNNFHLLSEIWILDVQKDNKWIKSKFPVPIAFAGICSVNEEFIYVVGGRCVGLNGKLQPSEKVWCYSVTTKRWQQIASLNQPRCNCCCVLLDNRIYTFGGSLENDAEHLRGQTGEFYELTNPNQGWKMLNKNLPTSISGQSVALLSSF